MRWRWKRQKIQTDTSGNDLLLLQKIEALEDVLSEAQSLLVDVKGLLAESENGGGGRKEKSEEEAVRKCQKQHKEKKSQEGELQFMDDNPTYILQHQGSIDITTTKSVMTRGGSDMKVTSMLTFSFSSDVKTKPVKGGGDRSGLPKRSKGGRRTNMMLTASELGIVAMGYSDGSIDLHDNSGKRIALWNAGTDVSPVVKLSFQSKRGRSALVALNANGQLSSFEIGAWRWGRCISGGVVHAHQLNNDKLKNNMKDDYWNVVERGKMTGEDGLVVAIRSVEEEQQQQLTIEERGWCNGDRITAVEPIVIGGKEGNPMKLILAVGSASGNVWMIRASDSIKVASFSQVLLHDDDRGPVISIKRSGSHLAVAFKRSSRLVVYRIPRNLISDATVDKKSADVAPVEISTYGGCDALTDITSLSFDRMVPSVLFVGLDNGHVISIGLKMFTYEREQDQEKLNVYLPCRPKSTTKALPEAVHSLDAAKGYVLAGGTLSAVMLNATSVLSLGLRRAFDVVVSTGNSNGVKLYEALIPQVANHNNMPWVRLPVFVIILLAFAWHRLRHNDNEQKCQDFLMGKEEDLRFKEVEMELSRLEMRRFNKKRSDRNHHKPRLRVKGGGVLQRYIKTDVNHQPAQAQAQTHLNVKGEKPPHPILEENEEEI